VISSSQNFLRIIFFKNIDPWEGKEIFSGDSCSNKHLFRVKKKDTSEILRSFVSFRPGKKHLQHPRLSYGCTVCPALLWRLFTPHTHCKRKKAADFISLSVLGDNPCLVHLPPFAFSVPKLRGKAGGIVPLGDDKRASSHGGCGVRAKSGIIR
jgi:hypothetical protein